MSNHRVFAFFAARFSSLVLLYSVNVFAQTAPISPTSPTDLAPSEVDTKAGPVITTDEVVRGVLQRNAALQSASMAILQASAAKEIQEGKFPYLFQADAGVTRSQTPSLRNHDVSVSERTAFVVGSQLSKSFPSGTTATLRAEGQRYESKNPGVAQTTTLPTFSTGTAVGYQATVRATVSQPLLSGYGATVNEASIRAARIAETRSRRSFERQTSELLRDALNAYWELWYDGRAIEIQTLALELAAEQQRSAEQRVAQGALSPADALKFRTQLASLTETLLIAQATERTQAFELARLLGSVENGDELRAAATEPEVVSFYPRSELFTLAVSKSPAISELKEALRLAEDKRKVAGDEFRARLDLSAWAEATGLAAEHVKPVVQRLGGLDAVSVYGGVTYQTTLDSRRLHGARSQADYEVRVAQANLESAITQLKAQTAQLLVKAEQASASFDAASKTLEVATMQAQNERQRFSLGASTPLEVQVAEDALRQAQLRVVRARVDRVKSWLSLAHLTGDLLSRYVSNRAGVEK
jgi:outer membrane protein TolC